MCNVRKKSFVDEKAHGRMEGRPEGQIRIHRTLPQNGGPIIKVSGKQSVLFSLFYSVHYQDFKLFYWSILNFLFRSFIVLCYSLIWLWFLQRDYLSSTIIFIYRYLASSQVFVNTFLLLAVLVLLLWLHWGLWFIYFVDFWKSIIFLLFFF